MSVVVEHQYKGRASKWGGLFLGLSLKLLSIKPRCSCAGSERVGKSEATGDRLEEAKHINKSLSALGKSGCSFAHHQLTKASNLVWLCSLQKSHAADADCPCKFINQV